MDFNSRHKGTQPAFEVTPAVIEEFQEFLKARKVKWSPADIEENSDRLKGEIKEAIVLALWGMEEAYKVHAEIDLQLLKALDLFPQAQNLAALGGARPPANER